MGDKNITNAKNTATLRRFVTLCTFIKKPSLLRNYKPLFVDDYTMPSCSKQ